MSERVLSSRLDNIKIKKLVLIANEITIYQSSLSEYKHIRFYLSVFNIRKS